MSESARCWRYQLDRAFVRHCPTLEPVQFTNEWLQIIDGVLTVSKDYAWDGCSPAWFVPLFGWVGTPDGPKDANGLPQSYYPTLVHDALCQFRRYLALDKATAVALLREMLLEYGFPSWRARFYAFMVYHFGPQDWPGRTAVDVS